MKKMVAISRKGAEFAYKRVSAHAVPASSAAEIAAALNESMYMLKPGEIWAVHDLDWYTEEYTAAGYQRFTRRRGTIYRSRY